MFGKSVFRLMTIGLAGAIALFLGGQLLSSVTWVVFAWRFGNITPLVTVWGGTIVMLLLTRRENKEPLSTVLNIISWACIIYTGVVMLFIALPYGLIAGFIALGATVMVCSSIKEPDGVTSRFSNLLEPSGHSIPMIGKPTMSRSAAWSSIHKLKMKAIVLPSDLRGTTIDLLRERPLLPVSLTRYEECDIMIVRTEGEEKVMKQVKLALSEKGIENIQTLSPFVTNAILGLPLLEQEDGMALNEYMVASDEATVNRLLEMWPNRITVFPNRLGLRVIIRYDSAPGFDLEELPQGREAHILLGRDNTLIPTGGKEIAGESTA